MFKRNPLKLALINFCFIIACYNRRHRRSANSTPGAGQNYKGKARRISQDTDEVDDDSLAAGLLVSTVQNLRSLCAFMLDGIR